MAKKQDELLNSNYDGIQEFDNDLPKWWLGIFYTTIIFACLYAPYYWFHIGPNSEEQLAAELKAIQPTTNSAAPAEVSSAQLLALTKDPGRLASGKEVFAAKCAACHSAEGQGLVGPNLTDEYWIHGGKITDTYKVVTTGILDKGMLAWKGLLPENQIQDVVAYIYTLRGTTPANPKAPQGEKYIGNE
ncbi:MAG: c-type cytochrome [Deltaproteobacteria bacterium]|nr:c-type cytochrome [Deltaproteobacteria bacterium]